MARTVSVALEMIVAGYRRNAEQAKQTTRELGAEMRQLPDVAKRNSAAFTAAGLAMSAAGAAIGLGLRKAGQEAAQFEARLTKSTTLIGVSRDEMQKMGQQALRLSDTGQGPQDLADALFFVQSAGLRGAEAMSVVEASAKASSIGLGETAVVADLVTSAVNAYGSESLSASQATDILIGSVREGKAEASELAGSMGRVLPIASEMGVTFDEVGAAVAAMTRTGTDAATSTTQLRAILVSLIKPAQQSEQALQDLGLSSGMLRDTIQREGLWAALVQLRGAIGDNDEALGRIFPNVRALAGFLDLTGANVEANAAVFANMADTTGLLAEGFAEWSQTTEAAQMRFSAAMEAARISLGEGLQAPMKAVLDLGTGLAQTFTDLPGPMQRVAALGGGVAAVGSTLAGGFLLAAPRIVDTKRALADLSETMPRTVGLIRGAGSLLTGPFGVALGAATVATFAFAKAKADSQKRIEAFTAAIEADTGALGRNTRELAINELQQRDAFEAAQMLGISRQDLVGALLGEEDALRRVNIIMAGRQGAILEETSALLGGVEANEGMASAYNTIHGALKVLTPEIGEASAEWRESAEAMAESEGRYLDVAHAISTGLSPAAAQLAVDMQEGKGHFGANAAAAGELGDEFGDLTEEISAADEAFNDYVDSLRKATDPVFALESALSDIESAQADYNEAVKEHGPNSDEARDASLRLMRAVRDMEEAAIAGDLSFDDFESQLKRWVDMGVITEGQAKAIRGRVDEAREAAEDYQGGYNASITESGADTVIEKLEKIGAIINGLPSRKDVTIAALTGSHTPTFGHTQREHGGPVAAGRPYVVGEVGPEVFVPSVSGRIVPHGRAAAAMGGPITRIHAKHEESLDPADFINTAGAVAAAAGRAAGLAAGRVLPRGSYRIGRGSRAHGYGALDLPAPIGTPVYSVAPGVVTRAMRLAGSYGVHAFVNHPGGRQSRYAHLSALHVRQGMGVGRGQRLGSVGSTGNSTGPHLHYEDLLNGMRRMPERLGIFDNGGVLPAGGLGSNSSTRPEVVFTESQWNILKTLAGRSGGGGFKAEVTIGTTTEAVTRQVRRELDYAAIAHQHWQGD